MNKHLKHHIAAITATTTLLALLATAAPARNFSTSNQQFRVTWNELDFAAATSHGDVQCHARRLLPLQDHIKNVGRLIGYITSAAARRPCTNGEAWSANGREAHPRLGTLANTLPWHLTYEAFVGTLPNITSIHFLLRGLRFKIHSLFNTIGLYGDANDNITARTNRNVATGVIEELEPVAGRTP